jgi:hypothetical protein
MNNQFEFTSAFYWKWQKLVSQPCIEDEGKMIRRPYDNEKAEFYGVYAITEDGEYYWVADFNKSYQAKRFIALVNKLIETKL